MDVTITVRRCDKCKRPDREATRYTLAVDEGKPVTRDLCDEDAAPVLEAFGEAVTPAPEKPGPLYLNSGDEAAGTKAPAPRKAPAEKAEKKAPAKKAATRRRGKTPVMSLEEIERLKAAAKQ